MLDSLTFYNRLETVRHLCGLHRGAFCLGLTAALDYTTVELKFRTHRFAANIGTEQLVSLTCRNSANRKNCSTVKQYCSPMSFILRLSGCSPSPQPEYI